jgi:hypothetical protein
MSTDIAWAELCNCKPLIMEVVMDLLVTVIGNAVVNQDFRKELLDGSDPLPTIEEWGFHLTKGEGEMLKSMIEKADKTKLEGAFNEVWNLMFPGVDQWIASLNGKCGKPCMMSIGKLHVLAQQPTAATVQTKKGKAA